MTRAIALRYDEVVRPRPWLLLALSIGCGTDLSRRADAGDGGGARVDDARALDGGSVVDSGGSVVDAGAAADAAADASTAEDAGAACEEARTVIGTTVGSGLRDRRPHYGAGAEGHAPCSYYWSETLPDWPYTSSWGTSCHTTRYYFLEASITSRSGVDCAVTCTRP